MGTWSAACWAPGTALASLSRPAPQRAVSYTHLIQDGDHSGDGRAPAGEGPRVLRPGQGGPGVQRGESAGRPDLSGGEGGLSLIHIWWYPAIVLAAIALGLIIGGVIQRFGGKGGWFLWAIWMAVIFGDSLFGGFVFLKDLVPLMVVLLAGSLVWSVWSLLHAVVKN